MIDVSVIDAVRTPIGRRNGGLAGVHPASLLGTAQRALIERTGIDPGIVGQVVGGCVTQIGEQSINITRMAWLSAGLPETVGASTVDAQCGSSQQATSLASALVGAGAIDVAVGCGVESMSRMPLGANMNPELGLGSPVPSEYERHHEWTSQFEASERIADEWGISRRDADEFGLLSQQRAQQAWKAGHFVSQIVPVTDEHGGQVDRDGGLRETSLEALAGLKPVGRPDGVHTAGSASQISDGAGAVLVASPSRANELGLEPRARIRDMCLVGSDPVLMLTGPIPATRLLLERNGLTIDDIDVVEINEAFASVVLAWQRELGADMEKVNPNGGAIALGHPVGATGAILITKALNELERIDGSLALVTMCCGGGLGTGMLLERIEG